MKNLNIGFILAMAFSIVFWIIFTSLVFGGRSSQWPKVRAEYLKKHPTCAVCDGTKKLEVHHITPFSDNSALELDANNLITLCEGKKGLNCHFVFGHLCNYQKSNPDVRKDASEWNKKLKQNFGKGK